MKQNHIKELAEKGIDQTYAEGEIGRNVDGLEFSYGPWDACDKCGTWRWRKNGFDRYGTQRYRCMNCGRSIRGHRLLTGAFDQERPFNLNRPVVNKLPEIISLLTSGRYSIRDVERITSVNRNTVMKVLRLLEGWLEGRDDFQRELGITVPIKCVCGKALRGHNHRVGDGMCRYRRKRCGLKSLGKIG